MQHTESAVISPELSPSPATDPAQRAVWLDVLRGIAILLVACGHMAAAFAIPKDIATFGRPIWFGLIQLAVAGVDIFLVLSGFLLGQLLLTELRDTGTIDLLRFYKRRALRLLPIYWLAVLFAWQWYRLVPMLPDGRHVPPPSLSDMWPFFLLIQNYYDIHVHNKLNIGAVMQTWTLALIVQFWLVAPLVLWALHRISKRLRPLPYLAVAAFVACFLMRKAAAPANANDYDAWKQYFPTHLRFDELLGGVLVAWWVVFCKEATARFVKSAWPVLVLLGIAAFVPVAVRAEEGPPFLIVWGYTLAGIGCMPLILVGWHFAHRAPQPVRWFSMVGVWSYSIYLWHQPSAQVIAYRLRGKIFGAMSRHHLDPWHSQFQYLMSAVIYFCIVLAIGLVTYYGLERPILWLREKRVTRWNAAGTASRASATSLPRTAVHATP
jgi:peptidoglycan/LPS O-acetylase OafA/YrhL